MLRTRSCRLKTEHCLHPDAGCRGFSCWHLLAEGSPVDPRRRDRVHMRWSVPCSKHDCRQRVERGGRRQGPEPCLLHLARSGKIWRCPCKMRKIVALTRRSKACNKHCRRWDTAACHKHFAGGHASSPFAPLNDSMASALCGLLISPARQHHIRGVACRVRTSMSHRAWPGLHAEKASSLMSLCSTAGHECEACCRRPDTASSPAEAKLSMVAQGSCRAACA